MKQRSPCLPAALCAWLLSVCPLCADDPAPLLQRGPYLQMPTPTAITVCWRTDIPGKGRVRYGTAQNELTEVLGKQDPAADHELRLTKLTPATRYYYQVETGGAILAAGDTCHFVTPPPDGSGSPVRFWVLGDCGTASEAQRQVRDAFAPLHAQRRADFWLMLGDNAYYSGTDEQYQAAVFDMYPEYLRQLPLWSCIGNHETYGGADKSGKYAYDNIFVFPTAGECGGVASGTERYYSWNYANIHFVSLDAMTADRSSVGPMANWLRADLEANIQPWVIAFWHHPPYSRGSHYSDFELELIEMRANILPILESYGVDLVLCGHSHVYERSYLLDGHYGLSPELTGANKIGPGSGREDGDGAYYKTGAGMAPHEGAVYVTAGSSGQAGGGSLDHPAHFIAMSRLGSLVVDVAGARMDVKFLREAAVPGAVPVFDDYFTIIKGVAPPPPPALVRGPYLQMAAPTAMSVCWRTDTAATGRVRFGTSAGAFTGIVDETGGVRTEHSVRLSGLTPGTKYYYTVQSRGFPMAGGPEFFFTTPPAPGSHGPVRIWTLGDPGTNSPAQFAVRDAFRAVHAEKPADLWLLLGDNAYGAGTDAEYQQALFDVYKPWLQQVPLWSCIGNHETYGDFVDGRYAWDNIFEFPTAAECGGVASGTERYYSWDCANIHFVALDSMTSSRAADGAMANWLRADLEANSLPWTISFWHHPPYTKGTHDSDFEVELIEMRENILPILEDYGADLVLCGHSHVYERSFLLDRHYATSDTLTPANLLNAGDGREDGDGLYVKSATGAAPHQGAVYVVAGCSGQLGGGLLNHPAHFLSLAQLGSLVIDVTDMRMDVRFLRENFEPDRLEPAFDDYFSILKGGPPPPVAPTGLSVLPLDSTRSLLHWESNPEAAERSKIRLSEGGIDYNTLAELPHGVTGYTLQNLAPGTSYHVKVETTNIAGSAVSEPFNFTQAANPPPVTAVEHWRFSYWGSITAAGEQNDTADYDRDGVVNVLEYALGSSPRNSSAVPAFHALLTPEGRLSLTFPRQAAPDITYAVEFAGALVPGLWEAAFTSTGANNVIGPVTVVDPKDPPGPRRFVRLKVTLE